MTDAQMEKVKSVLARMDETYWNSVVAATSMMEQEAQSLTTVFFDELVKLMVAQVDVLSAKYKGYKLLAETEDASTLAGIASGNKDRVAELMLEKHKSFDALNKTLDEMKILVGRANTIGE